MPGMTEVLSTSKPSRRKRKLTPDDRRLLAKVFKDHGADWTYKALAVWYEAMPFDELAKAKRWTTKRLAAFRFLREIMDDYTFNAIYNAADEIEQEAASRNVKGRRRLAASAR